MANPAEHIPESQQEPQPETEENLPITLRNLVDIAEFIRKGPDFIASITSLVSVGRISVDQGLEMLGVKKDEAIQLLIECQQSQINKARESAETVRSVGQRALDALSVLNPLHKSDKD